MTTIFLLSPVVILMVQLLCLNSTVGTIHLVDVTETTSSSQPWNGKEVLDHTHQTQHQKSHDPEVLRAVPSKTVINRLIRRLSWTEPASDESYEPVHNVEEGGRRNGSNSTYLPQEAQKHEVDHENHGIHVASWRWEYVKTPFIYTSFVIIAALCKVGYHHANFLSTVLPESCLLIVLGTAVGTIIYLTDATHPVPQFTSRAFFLLLLPPIVLESAYSLHDRAFFNNLGTILLYAVLGTLINCFLIGLSLYGLSECGAMGDTKLWIIECLVFSALISAVDPVAVLAIFQEIGVNKVLYFLVFGESLLNDASTVVLYTMMVGLSSSSQVTVNQIGLGIAAFLCVSLGGLIIGIFMGIVTALITKHTQEVRVVEPLALLGIAYLSYLLAEMIHFSGIISIIACGLVQAQYAFFNISRKTYTTVKYFSKMLSAVCDTIIFLFLGMVLVNDRHVWQTGFVLWSTCLCLLVRFFSVYLLTFLANYFQRLHIINLEEQFIMAYGGLRGAVAFSLVIMLDEKIIPNKSLFVTATLFIVLFTVFIQGSTIKPLVTLLKIRRQGQQCYSLFEEVNDKVVNNVMAGIEEVTGHHSENYWKQILYYYDEKYLKKWLQQSTSENTLTRVYTKMVLSDHFAHLYGPATAIEDNKPLLLHENTDDDLAAPLDNIFITSDEDEESKCSPKSEKITFKIDQVPESTSSQPSFSKRRHTLSALRASMRTSKHRATDEERDDTSKLLQKALRDNPYYKYHQKYNRNLVGDDQQELASHLRARKLRARRLTLAAALSGAASPALSTDDINAVQSHKEESSDTFSSPRCSVQLPSSPLYDPTSILLARANRRRSIMSTRYPKLQKANTISIDSPSDEHDTLHQQEALTDSLEDIKEVESGEENKNGNKKRSKKKQVRIFSETAENGKDETCTDRSPENIKETPF